MSSFQLSSGSRSEPIVSRNERERKAFLAVRRLIERGNDMLLLRVTRGALTILRAQVEDEVSDMPVAHHNRPV